MESKEKMHIYTVLLFILTAILHIIPVLMENNLQTMLLAGAALVYGPLGVILYIKPEIKLIKITGFVAPTLGLIAGTGLLIMYNGTTLANWSIFLGFLLILDVIIIPIRYKLWKIE